MTSLDPNALIVSMVQVANSLPMFLFAIPAGALADMVNQRRFLIFGESAITIISAAFAALVWLHLITAGTLLLFSFVVTIGSAMTAPAWQSVVAKLVRSDRRSAASSSERLELQRPFGSMPLATLGSLQLSYGGVSLRRAAHPCRPNLSEAQYVRGFATLDTVHISEPL
jgi:MFS family permease